MNLAGIIEFNKRLTTAVNMANDGTLGLLQEAFGHLTEYAISIETNSQQIFTSTIVIQLELLEAYCAQLVTQV